MQFENFTYKNGKLFCGDVNIEQVSEEIGTPFYLYNKKSLVDSYNEFDNAFNEIDHKIFYAVKSNSNLNVMKLFYSLGSGLDVNSAGEFYRAQKIGAKPSDILFTGVGKTREEILLGLQNDIFLFKAESLQEIELMNSLAEQQNKKARIAIRVNPNVNPNTHPYITTGLYESKFGIDEKSAMDAFKFASSLSNIQIIGIDIHIGSQITDISAYYDAIEIILKLINELRAIGIEITHLDIGGGLGIQYNEKPTPKVKDLANLINPLLKASKCKILMEPGRYLTGNAGCLVSKVLYTKTHREKNFLIIDSAMNDLLRPALYNAYHHILPIDYKEKEEINYDVVGPVCETGDFLALNRKLPKMKANELLAIMSAGAYGSVMSSNYNSRRKLPEVIVDGNKYYVVRERESFDDLIRNERVCDELFY